MEILIEHDVTELDPVDPAQFADEVRTASSNFRVGSEVCLETEQIRMWNFVLPPGYRHPFHCHRTNYCWICTAAGTALQRLPDGRRFLQKMNVGEIDYAQSSESEPLIHDLENVGPTTLRFVTIELLD